MQGNTAVSEKQVDNKRSENSKFSTSSFFAVRFLSVDSSDFFYLLVLIFYFNEDEWC
jgi:hypothetical protein